MIHEHEIERAVLAALLLESDAILSVKDLLTEEDFTNELHQSIWRTIQTLHNNGRNIDLLTVTSELVKTSNSPKFSVANVAGILENVNSSANLISHSYILREMAFARRLRASIAEAHQRLVNKQDPFEVSDTLLLALKSASDFAIGLGGVKNFSDSLLKDTITAIADANAQYLAGKPAGIPTNIEVFDLIFGGLFRAELFVVAARPGHGKTNFLVEASIGVASRYPTFICSLEMKDIDIGRRYIAREIDVPYSRLRSGTITPAQLARAQALMADSPSFFENLFVSDKPAMTIDEIRREVRSLNKRLEGKGTRLHAIFIDYLQIMSAVGSGMRYEKIGDLAQHLKNLAKDENISVCVLVQSGRGTDSAKKTMLSDLRESAGIEMAADSVLALENVGKWGLDQTESGELAKRNINGRMCDIIYCRCLKNRNGTINDFHLAADNALARFYSLPDEVARIRTLLQSIGQQPSPIADDDFIAVVEEIEAERRANDANIDITDPPF